MQATDELIIRKATAADIAGILACLRAAFEPYRSAYTPQAYLDTVLTQHSIYPRLWSMEVLAAVTDENNLVGTIAYAGASKEEGHLRGMAVLPDWQGRGLASRLLLAAETELAKGVCTRITLDTTEPLERAMHFYEKHGYRRSGKVTDFFRMPLHEYSKNL